MDKTLIQPIYPQLRFGVELSRLYPPWYVHPALKNLIYETRINTERRKEFTLNEILSHAPNHSPEDGQNAYHFAHREFVSETLYLKNRLVCGKNILGINASPGVHIWLLRHFLGLLPSSLFPSDSTKPNHWINISRKCKDALISMRMKNINSNFLIEDIITRELIQLPSRNIALLFELFELFRSLGTRLFVKTEIDKRSAITIVKYFTSCLFTRPFRVDIVTTNDERLYAFVLYIIFFWPSIKSKCQKHLSEICDHSAPSRLYYLEDIKEENEEDIENIVDELLLKNSQITFSKDYSRMLLESPRKQKEKSSDEEPVVYLVDNCTQTNLHSFEFHSTLDNCTSTPFQTAENLNLTEEENRKSSNVNTKKSTNVQGDDVLEAYNKMRKNSKISLSSMIDEDNQSRDGQLCVSKLSCISEEDLDSYRTTNLSIIEDALAESKQKLNDMNSEIKTSLLNTTYDIDEMQKSSGDREVQVVTVKETKKVLSSKVTRLTKRFRKGSQIIILHINPCKCPTKKTRLPKKARQPKWVETDLFEEKNNFESAEKAAETSDNKVQNATILDLPNLCCNYTKNIYSNSDNVRPRYGWNPSTCSTENEAYIKDSFIDNPQTYKTFETFAPSNPFSPTNYAVNSPETIKNRMAKIGWTYGETSGESTPMKKISKNSSKSHLEADKRYFTKKNLNIFNSLRKVGSKLNILKGLTPKFSRQSASAENLITCDNIKYEKLPKRANSL